MIDTTGNIIVAVGALVIDIVGVSGCDSRSGAENGRIVC